MKLVNILRNSLKNVKFYVKSFNVNLNKVQFKFEKGKRREIRYDITYHRCTLKTNLIIPYII